MRFMEIAVMNDRFGGHARRSAFGNPFRTRAQCDPGRIAGTTLSEILPILDVRRARLVRIGFARRIERRAPQILRTDADLAAPRRAP